MIKRRPKTSIACPMCKERVGFLAGLKALTPFVVRCPHCRVWLRVQMPGMFLYVIALTVMLAFVIGSLLWVRSVFGPGWEHLYALAILGAGLLLDLGTSVLFFTYATFTPIRIRLRLRR